MDWIERLGLGARGGRAFAVLVSFVGIFALSWMVVPDLPLILGWMLAFVGTWRACFGERAEGGGAGRALAMIAAGSALLMASKYSGVLAVFSSAACVLMWAPRERRWRGVLLALAGALLTLVPNLVWNAHHEWGAIAYQFLERHGDGHASWIRFGRFWAIQFLIVGPLLFATPFVLLRESVRGEGSRVARFLLVWLLRVLS